MCRPYGWHKSLYDRIMKYLSRAMGPWCIPCTGFYSQESLKDGMKVDRKFLPLNAGWHVRVIPRLELPPGVGKLVQLSNGRLNTEYCGPWSWMLSQASSEIIIGLERMIGLNFANRKLLSFFSSFVFTLHNFLSISVSQWLIVVRVQSIVEKFIQLDSLLILLFYLLLLTTSSIHCIVPESEHSLLWWFI